MTGIDIREILEENPTLLFAADQEAFTHGKAGGIQNHFCVLVPLMTLDGRPVGDRQSEFPNRGRVWWMLRQDLVSVSVQPGSLWSGKIERAVKPDKDNFQVERSSVTPGARDWVEILPVDAEVPDLGWLCGEAGIPFDRQPLKRVLIRGREATVGPLVATYRPNGTLELKALNAGNPTTNRIPTAALDASGVIQRFEFEAARWNPHEPERVVRLQLLHERHLADLASRGEEIDAASEAQVVKWALGLAGYTNKQRSVFREALDAAPDVDTAETAAFPGRLERFRRLCADADRVLALGADVAAVVAATGGFRDLVEAHVETIAAAAIEQRIRTATDQIERKTALARKNLETVEAELRQVEETFAARKSAQEEQLRTEHVAFVGRLEQQQADIERREAELGDREKDIQARLEQVIADYRTEADEITRRVLGYAPILQRLAGDRDRDREMTAGGATRREVGATLALPGYLSGKVAVPDITQAQFLDQFRSVVERRGFVYHDADLVNFHLSLGVGLWTVVAGPTGLGKSSLPRLYAEALGMHERLLKIAVQPDWLDDRDLIGAYNSLSGRFEPATAGLVQQLIFAEQDVQRGCGGIYIVVLDEMNLSRVEHYFARFLSLLEDPREQRELRVLGQGIGSEDDPFSQHRTIRIGDNVRFVGTVNVDETAHFFSPKVLDRSTLLALERPDLGRATGTTTKAQQLAVQPIDQATWSSWRRESAAAPDQARALLLQLDEHLRLIQSGVGFRLLDRILAYVASAQGLLDGDQPLDYAIAQNVMPRLRTQHAGFPQAAEAMLGLLPPERFPKCGRILEMLREADGAYDFFQLL